MNEKLNLTRMDGTTAQVDIICYLENIQTGKKYLYYTMNEVVGTGANSTVKVYVSNLKENNPVTDTPIIEAEWGELKAIMAEVLKGASNSTIKYLPYQSLSNPTSVSDKVIAMPTSYDYINKHRGAYAQAVAAMDVTPATQAAENPVVPETPVPTEQLVPDTPVVPVVEEKPLPKIETPVISEPTPVENPEIKIPTAENVATELKPIVINEIEQKYADMISTVNKLKEQEIEAANRYNATLELSAMHNEQHANYVASEQVKETAPVEQPVPMNTPVQPEPIVNNVPEPAAVAPIIPEPETNNTNPAALETNWFDIPVDDAA